MRYILKLLTILLVLTHITLFAEEFKKPPYDKRLDIDSRAMQWYNNANRDSASAFNIGLLYQTKIKDTKWAEFWYKKALFISNNAGAFYNLAYLYKNQNKNNQAKIFYQKAYDFGHKGAANNLGLLFANQKLYKKAIYWYRQSIERESLDSMKNLSLLYHKKLNDNLKAVEYFLPLINHRYSKKKVMKFFKVKYKVDKKTIQKGYEAQLKSKIIPEKLKYKGGI